MQPTTTTKVTIRNNRRVISELIYKSDGNIQPAYEPEHIGRISRQEVEEKYMSHSKYNQMLSDKRKEEIWQQILENRQKLASIVLTTRHQGNRIIRPLPQQVSMFTKSVNAVNRVINSIFDHQSTPYSQIQQFKLA